MMPCHSSGSSSEASFVDPLTSAKRIVTCLRSPSRALRNVRIFSTRCFGVYDRGVWLGEVRAGDAARAPPVKGAAHSLQNLAAAGFAVPQAGHGVGRGAAHSLQNLAPSRFSWSQPGHFMTFGSSRELFESTFASLNPAIEALGERRVDRRVQRKKQAACTGSFHNRFGRDRVPA